MTRNIFVVLSAILLSALLLTVATWIMLQATPQGRALVERGSEWYEQGDPFEVMAQTLLMMELLICAIISIATGAFVGLLTWRLSWQLAAVAALPFAAFMALANSGSLGGILLGAVYWGLSSATPFVVSRWKTTKRGDSIKAA